MLCASTIYNYRISPNKSALPNSTSPRPEKPLNHDNIMNICRLKQQYFKNLMIISPDLINISSYAFPKQRILDPLKLKEFEDDDFKFEEIGRKFSKWLENTVGKGKLLIMSNFSFSHSASEDLY